MLVSQQVGSANCQVFVYVWCVGICYDLPNCNLEPIFRKPNAEQLTAFWSLCRVIGLLVSNLHICIEWSSTLNIAPERRGGGWGFWGSQYWPPPNALWWPMQWVDHLKSSSRTTLPSLSLPVPTAPFYYGWSANTSSSGVAKISWLAVTDCEG